MSCGVLCSQRAASALVQWQYQCGYRVAIPQVYLSFVMCVCVYIYIVCRMFITVRQLSIPFKNPRLRQSVVSTVTKEGLSNGDHLFHKLHSVVAALLHVKTCGSFPPEGTSSILVVCPAKTALILRLLQQWCLVALGTQVHHYNAVQEH